MYLMPSQKPQKSPDWGVVRLELKQGDTVGRLGQDPGREQNRLISNSGELKT